MGKGDQKSRRGKINAGSYGKRRPRNKTKAVEIKVEEPVAKPKAKRTKKTEE